MEINLTELALRIENDLQLNDTKKSKELAEYFIKLLCEHEEKFCYDCDYKDHCDNCDDFDDFDGF